MWYHDLVETGRVPDWLLIAVLRTAQRISVLRRRHLTIDQRDAARRELLARLRAAPIAIATERANDQHYQVPTAFF